jgi:uncharacterized membrane protein required for colicin V production
MPNWIDVVVPVLILIVTIWGFTTGYWEPLVAVISLIIGVAVAGRFDAAAAERVAHLVTTPSYSLVEALVFILLTVLVTAIASGIVAILLGFARPTTRSARSLPSAHLLGAVFGFAFGVVLASVVLMTAYLGSSDLPAREVAGAATLRGSITRATVVPPLWHVVHLEARGLQKVIGQDTSPPFNVP